MLNACVLWLGNTRTLMITGRKRIKLKNILEALTWFVTILIATLVGNFAASELQKNYGSHRYYYTADITTSEAGVYRNGVPTKLFDKATYKNKGFIVIQNKNYQDHEDKIKEKILDEIITGVISGTGQLGAFYSVSKITVTSITRLD